MTEGCDCRCALTDPMGRSQWLEQCRPEIDLASELAAHDFSSPGEPPTLLEQLAQPPPELTRHREPSTASNHTSGAVPALRNEAEL
jgi:hypothetical protein